MIQKKLVLPFLEYWSNGRINYSIRVFIALVGVVFPCWWYEITSAITPLVLGIIACALAETDDDLSGRLSALFTTLLCFAVATFSVNFLFQFPLLFSLGLLLSTFCFIMLGAIGPRYASIAFASLIIAVYTMLGVSDSNSIFFQSYLLLIGASWYGVISLIWLILWPFQATQQNLANVYKSLSHYLEQKNEMFFNSEALSLQPLQISDANENALVVNALIKAKGSLLNILRHGQVNETTHYFLRVHFLAQDIHERANAAHAQILQLKDTFIHSDVMFRLQHLLRLQAKACLDVSHSLRLSVPYQHNVESSAALLQLKQSMAYIQSQNPLKYGARVRQLEYIQNNLATIEEQLILLHRSKHGLNDKETITAQRHSFLDKLRLIKNQLALKSLLFRHAVRLSLTICAGYGIIQAFDLNRGYWILLTILFVCQPNYSATRNKLTQRISGTIIGLLIGMPLLGLFPDLTGQLVLMVLFGVLFFAFRAQHYALATVFITLLVLMCFNQLGDGYAVILPRLSDTLIGCFLSVVAVRFILPDWQAERIRKIMTKALRANRDYFALIISQYQTQRCDNVTYRKARREAHYQDAKLSKAMGNMLSEPGRYRASIDESFHYLCLNHTFLSYLSILSAQRAHINEETTQAHLRGSQRQIEQDLDHLIEKLVQDPSSSVSFSVSSSMINPSLLNKEDIDNHCAKIKENNHCAPMLFEQLQYICLILPKMEQIIELLEENTPKNSKP